jgi:NADH dehydrogenase
MSRPARRLLVLGGTGFVGRSTVARLLAAVGAGGLVLTVPSRRAAHARALGLLPGVELCTADVHDPATLRRLVEGQDAVLNLVAVLHADAATFQRVHVELPRQLVRACEAAGVPRLLHVSALGVPDDPAQAPSMYLRSKAEGEAVLRAATGLRTTVVRPSVIFGAGDRFLRLFAALQRLAPVVPLAGAGARFQPVWVEDVAGALATLLLHPSPAHAPCYELAGPEVWTLKALVEAAGRWSGHPRPVLPVPDAIGRLQALLLKLKPGEPLLSADNLASMRVPNVASGARPGLAALGIAPSGVASVMAPVLAGDDPMRRFDVLRGRVGGG